MNLENVTFLHHTVETIIPKKKVILLHDGICTYDTFVKPKSNLSYS